MELDANDDTLRRVHHDLVRTYHPDRNPAADAAACLGEVIFAYRVLFQPEPRAAYNQHLKVVQSAEARGYDVTYEVVLSPEEARDGVHRALTF